MDQSKKTTENTIEEGIEELLPSSDDEVSDTSKTPEPEGQQIVPLTRSHSDDSMQNKRHAPDRGDMAKNNSVGGKKSDEAKESSPSNRSDSEDKTEDESSSKAPPPTSDQDVSDDEWDDQLDNQSHDVSDDDESDNDDESYDDEEDEAAYGVYLFIDPDSDIDED